MGRQNDVTFPLIFITLFQVQILLLIDVDQKIVNELNKKMNKTKSKTALLPVVMTFHHSACYRNIMVNVSEPMQTLNQSWTLTETLQGTELSIFLFVSGSNTGSVVALLLLDFHDTVHRNYSSQ